MQRTKPPFRADMVGSLLRPDALKEARAKRASGEITADQLRAVEDREIEKVVARQAEVGLQSATDGEFRRSWWHFDFLAELDGCKLVKADHGIQFAGVQTKSDAIAIVGKIGWPASHPMIG
ncbi:MAG: 5-methyltetrahydropteroyltriglutamate--homocysteine S-methyltransferase, partial [Bauldia sp.]